MSDSLDTLLANQKVWHCRETPGVANEQAVPSGYAKLDRKLPQAGWPRGTLIEVLTNETGIGELRLLMPALAGLAATELGTIVWVGAPYQPYAPALQQWGVEARRVLLIQPETVADALWATAEALSSPGVLAVLGWLPQLNIRDSRRLQLAAASGRSLAFVFRPAQARQQTSAASLRLALQAGSRGTEIDLFKVRGARPCRIGDYEGSQAQGIYLQPSQATMSASTGVPQASAFSPTDALPQLPG